MKSTQKFSDLRLVTCSVLRLCNGNGPVPSGPNQESRSSVLLLKYTRVCSRVIQGDHGLQQCVMIHHAHVTVRMIVILTLVENGEDGLMADG